MNRLIGLNRNRAVRWQRRIVLMAVATLGLAGCRAPRVESNETATAGEEVLTMRRVTGIGGVFFKSSDPERTVEWYRDHLGIESGEFGGFAFQWREKERPDETGYTVWSAFPSSTDYFSPSEQPFMINFRVEDLTGLIAALKEEGVRIVGGIEQHPNGKFAWILDPEGRKVELWEPVPSADDPYLR